MSLQRGSQPVMTGVSRKNVRGRLDCHSQGCHGPLWVESRGTAEGALCLGPPLTDGIESPTFS